MGGEGDIPPISWRALVELALLDCYEPDDMFLGAYPFGLEVHTNPSLVICGHIVGHGAVNLPPIDLKPLQVDYWSHYLSFDMSLNMGNAIIRLIFKNFNIF